MKTAASKFSAAWMAVAALALSFQFAPSAWAQGAPQTIDSIVAVVNDEVVTRNELDERVAFVERQFAANPSTQRPARALVEKNVLERLILDRIQIQLARDKGIAIDDTMLDRTIARIAEQNGSTVQEFRDRIEREGTPYARFREDVRNEIILTRLREREVDDRTHISEGEIDNFLATQGGASADASMELDVSHILLRLPEQASPQQIEAQRAKAQDIYRQLQGGADFAQLSVSYSEAAEALSGGGLGWRPQDRLPQLYVDAVASLQPGQIAAPIKSPNGFHILKLNGKRGGGAGSVLNLPPVQQTHARHILIRVNELVSAQQAYQRLLDVKQRIENNSATFEEMARAYSNDGSATRGGDLGFLYPGDTVPEFERVMNALAPGVLSDPVQTQFGLHLIQVIERKTQDVSQERVRMMARQALRERKSDEYFEDWLRKIRDEAYVEYRLE